MDEEEPTDNDIKSAEIEKGWKVYQSHSNSTIDLFITLVLFPTLVQVGMLSVYFLLSCIVMSTCPNIPIFTNNRMPFLTIKNEPRY